LLIRGRSYEVFNMEIVMLTALGSLYVLSTMLWYNFLSLYLSSFFEVEDVGLLLSILTGGGMLSIILGGLLADSLGRRPAIAIAIIGVAVATVTLGFSRSFMVLALAILVFSLCSQSLRAIIRVFVAEKLPDEVRGRGLGVILTIVALVGVIAPTVGGYLIETHGFTFTLLLSATITITSLIPLLSVRETASRRGAETWGGC